MKYGVFFLVAASLMSPLTLTSASAQTPPSAEGLIPPLAPEASPNAALPPLEGETHPALNLSPDKSELVRLDREASSVVVGNPTHATVMLDTPRLAVVIPRSAGATYFTVLDKDGNVIMQRHVIVAAPKKNYVRIRRSCNAASSGGSTGATNCQPTSVYFCPDMCHEIGEGGDDQTSRR